jgi:hypothetical protein
MHHQTPTGLLNLALLQQVQPIRPILHHPAELLHIFGVIVGRLWGGVRYFALRPTFEEMAESGMGQGIGGIF